MQARHNKWVFYVELKITDAVNNSMRRFFVRGRRRLLVQAVLQHSKESRLLHELHHERASKDHQRGEERLWEQKRGENWQLDFEGFVFVKANF